MAGTRNASSARDLFKCGRIECCHGRSERGRALWPICGEWPKCGAGLVWIRDRGSLNDRHIRWTHNRCTRERAVDSRAFLPPSSGQDAPAAFVGAWRGLLRQNGATAALEAEINGLRQIGELLRRELDDVGEDRDRSGRRSDCPAQGRACPVTGRVTTRAPRSGRGRTRRDGRRRTRHCAR